MPVCLPTLTVDTGRVWKQRMRHCWTLLAVLLPLGASSSASAMHITASMANGLKTVQPPPTGTLPACVVNPPFIDAVTTHTNAVMTKQSFLHTGPGEQCPISGTALLGQRVTATCGHAAGTHGVWCNVQAPEATGWTSPNAIFFPPPP